MKPVPGTKPIGATKAASTLKANPYVPVKTDISVKQQGNCLCVPVGKCLRPNGGSQQPSVSPTPAPITDGAGIIDIRIVNRVSPLLIINLNIRLLFDIISVFSDMLEQK